MVELDYDYDPKLESVEQTAPYAWDREQAKQVAPATSDAVDPALGYTFVFDSEEVEVDQHKVEVTTDSTEVEEPTLVDSTVRNSIGSVGFRGIQGKEGLVWEPLSRFRW